MKSNLDLITFKKLEVSVDVAAVADSIGVPDIINCPFPWRLVLTIFEAAAVSSIFTKTCLNTPETVDVKRTSPLPVPFVMSIFANFGFKSATMAFLTSRVVDAGTAS